MPPPALDWLLRPGGRDLALLALLSDCGLRAQEASDVQLRDLDLDAAMLTVRSGKGRKARRVQLTEQAIRTLRAYLKVRCPAGLPQIGSEAEREALLMKRNVTKASAPWELGLTTVAMRTHLAELRAPAVALIQEQAVKELSLERVAQMEALARQVALVSPHQLWYGLADRLWKTARREAIRQILGHSRVATTLKYGKPTEDDLRAALEDASRIR